MDTYILNIKDECRKNLNRYTLRAFSVIPEIENPTILDLGCGTGVSSLALIEKCNGTICAVDIDPESINLFMEKVSTLGLEQRIKIFQGSVFNPDIFGHEFDIVLAEGLLNVVGFEKGLQALVRHAKKGGFILIHDELKNDPEKRIIFESYNLKLLDSFILDKDVWWNDYYDCLEKKIKSINDNNQFENELKEINGYKINPLNYRSIYYILQR